MSFPNYPDKYQAAALMQPQHMLDVRRKLGRFPTIEPPEALIFCFKNGLPHQMRWQIPVRRIGGIMGDFHLVRRSHGRVAVLSNFGIGAPVVVSLAEELIAFGVKKCIILSWAGILQPDLKAGDMLICDRAIRDEGVSHHYLPTEKYACADQALTNRLKESIEKRGALCRVGTTWTTDAPYRETINEVRQYQAEGVQTVEMETAALFALGQVRGVQTASVVIGSDNLSNLTWQRPADMKAIDHAFRIAYLSVVDALC